ncbi:hypothetical protein ABZ260_51000 [Streptosporangium sp. NPDC006013]|uniref:hypothetical protein n=1 Tax=Streptosporangium sp. NPDC006013 TaxID=3155596 RepID=UPI0033BB74D1
MKEVALQQYARLPREYRGLEVLASTIDAYGRALWLLSDSPDALSDDLSRSGRLTVPPRKQPYDALLVMDKNGTASELVLHDVHLLVSKLDALPNGRFLLTGTAARHRPPASAAANAQIYGRDGRPRRSFPIGQPGHLLADRRHNVWTGYFDQAIYTDLISAPGLVRWDTGGNRQWAYQPPPGEEHIADCYALNVTDGVAWAYYYQAFSLIEIHTGGRLTIRETPVKGAHGLAICDDQVTFLASRGHHDRLHRCRLTDDAVLLEEEATLTMPGGKPLGRHRIVSRANALYLLDPSSHSWHVHLT